MKFSFVFFMFIFSNAYAENNCVSDPVWKEKTLLGKMTHSECGVKDRDPEMYELNGEVIYRASSPFMFKWSYPKEVKQPVRYYIFSTGDQDKKTKCGDRMVLLDFTGKNARAFNFGVRGSCHEFKKASYKSGKLRIVLKDNLEFIYQDGRFTLPARGVDLLSDFLPSQWFNPKTEDELVPYFEEYKK